MQARFTEALLKEAAHVDLPSHRIFSTTVSGQPKSEVLQELEQKHPNSTYHFVEDKLGTLDKVMSYKACLPCMFYIFRVNPKYRQVHVAAQVCQVKELEHWKLYLVDWGYNTKQERETAASNPRIQVVSHAQMSKALAA